MTQAAAVVECNLSKLQRRARQYGQEFGKHNANIFDEWYHFSCTWRRTPMLRNWGALSPRTSSALGRVRWVRSNSQRNQAAEGEYLHPVALPLFRGKCAVDGNYGNDVRNLLARRERSSIDSWRSPQPRADPCDTFAHQPQKVKESYSWWGGSCPCNSKHRVQIVDLLVHHRICFLVWNHRWPVGIKLCEICFLHGQNYLHGTVYGLANLGNNQLIIFVANRTHVDLLFEFCELRMDKT